VRLIGGFGRCCTVQLLAAIVTTVGVCGGWLAALRKACIASCEAERRFLRSRLQCLRRHQVEGHSHLHALPAAGPPDQAIIKVMVPGKRDKYSDQRL